MLPTKLVFVDVETTGGLPQRDRIIDIGMIRVEKDTVVDTFTSLVNPQDYLPPEITVLTGIESHQLEYAPTFRELQDRIKDLLRDAVFIAHNARFDASFIKSEFSRLEQTLTLKTLCTAKLSRRLFPGMKHHNLDSIIERFQIPCQVRHRALPDAQVLWSFFQKIQSQCKQLELEEAYAYVTKSAALPPNITSEMISKLPDCPGVYIFYDLGGAPLYIGKSVNIKDRVLSHFYEFSHSSKEANVYQRVGSVEAIKTSGELGALLLESSLIKKYQPLLNRQLRKSDRMIILSQTKTPEGYLTIQRRDILRVSPADQDGIVAIFKTERQCKDALLSLASEYSLCHKLLKLEKTKGRCFGSHLGFCHGACLGKELPAAYNMRFVQAFHKTKIRQWPFQGPVIVEEGTSKYVIDHWQYKGMMGADGRIEGDATKVFDYDTYKILSSYLLRLRKQRRSLRIIPFSQPSFDQFL